MWNLCVILSVIMVVVHLCGAFNVSPLPNIVAEEPKNQRIFLEKVRSSYFGYTVNLRTDSIMVGAPRAQTTIEMQRKINETGVIYKCVLAGQGPAAPCKPYVFDELGDINEPSANGYFRNERKEGQWLGMAMDGKGLSTDRFVVCAPKLVTPHTDEHYLLHGMCYVTANTSGDRPFERPVKIAPLRRTNLQVHEVAGERKLFYMYGEVGLSVHVSENSEEILIGAPGVYNWKGTVVRYRPRSDYEPGGLSKRDNYRRRDTGGGGGMERSQIVEYEVNVPNPNQWNQSDDSYFGFAVTSGYFRGPGDRQLLYAASAPQAAQQTGQVYIFDIVDYSVNVPEAKIIKKYLELTGLQMGEYFGYAILANDFNADQYPDLIVSAPFHSFDGVTDHGAVYYYRNYGRFDFRLVATLSGDTEAGSARFGMALGRIGDLDRDGYEDLAVGAPFEGNGAVYIFLGGPDGLTPKHAQKIVAPATNSLTTPAMFGMSVSRGVDVDGNAYNDMAVGAPSAEQVFVYRSYPVAKVIASVETDKRELVQSESQLVASVCVQLQPNIAADAGAQIKLQLTFKLDTQFGRAFFFDDKNNVRKFEMIASTQKKCQMFDISLKYKLEDIFKPLELELHYVNLNAVPHSEVFCDDCFALNPTDPAFVATKLIYKTGCSSDRCLADLRVRSEVLGTVIDPYILGSTRTLSFQYTVENTNEYAYLPQLRITRSPQLPLTKIPPKCRQEEESLLCDLAKAYLPQDGSETLLITLDTTRLDGEELRISAEAFSTGDERSPEDNVATNVIPLREFSEVEATGTASPNLVSLDASGDLINITHSFQIRNEGPSTLKAADVIISVPLWYVSAEDHRSQLVDFNRVFVNSRYQGRTLDVTWTQNDKILIQNPTESTLPVLADELDALKYDNIRMGLPDFDVGQDYAHNEQVQNEQVFRRRRRDVVEEVKTHNIYTQRVLISPSVAPRSLKYTYDDVVSNRTITFDGSNECDLHHCVQMKNTINNFKPSRSPELFVDVTVEMRLDQVAKLFSEKKDTFLFRMGVTVVRQGDESGGETVAHHLKLPYTTVLTTIVEGTPIWIYIVSSIVGVLVLIMLSYGLYRFGFFRRQTREELTRLTQESKLQADETDDE